MRIFLVSVKFVDFVFLTLFRDVPETHFAVKLMRCAPTVLRAGAPHLYCAKHEALCAWYTVRINYGEIDDFD